MSPKCLPFSLCTNIMPPKSSSFTSELWTVLTKGIGSREAAVFWSNCLWAKYHLCKKKKMHLHNQHSFHSVHLSEVTVVADVSTFELSSFPALSEFYWEIALTICGGHGKYFAGKTLCLLLLRDEPDGRCSCVESFIGSWNWYDMKYWFVMCNSQSKSQ